MVANLLKVRNCLTASCLDHVSRVGLHAEPVLLLQLLQLVLKLAATLLAHAVPGTLRALEFETI
jgi:hypothetical protein